MTQIPRFTRPSYAEALQAWKSILSARHLPADMLWIFDENLCFEDDLAHPGRFKLSFQTRFSPLPPSADEIAYEHFTEFDFPIVFYRLGSAAGKSVCVLLADEWFRNKGEAEGFIHRDDWLISFHPGAPESIEEITDRARWEARILRDRPLHDLDFCMTLRAVHETLAHGRVLSTYEHYALKFLHAWRQFLKQPQ
jgi:hypothetical protein